MSGKLDAERAQPLTLPVFLHSLPTEVGKGLLMPKGMSEICTGQTENRVLHRKESEKAIRDIASANNNNQQS